MIAEMLLGSVFATAAGGVGYLAVTHRRDKLNQERVRREALASFRESLVTRLRTRGASRDFRFRQYAEQAGVGQADAERVAEDIYRGYCEKVVADGTVSEDERKKLGALARFLDMDAVRAGEIEAGAKAGVYRQAVEAAVADGVVSGAEAAELESLRRSLDIDPEDAVGITGDLSREAYLAAVRRVVDRGVITPGTRADLNRLKDALVIRDVDARHLLRDESARLYRRLFAFVTQDGEVTPDEEATLDWLQREACVPDSEVRAAKARIADIRRFAEYRAGRLPVVKTRLMLDSGDACHWFGDCTYHYRTPSGQPKAAPGTLALTTKKVILQSPVRSLSFSPSRVLDVRRYSDGVELDVEGRGGTGTYLVGDPELLEAVVTGLVRRHKFLAVERYTSASSRHIPREVKVEVWHRDEGQCTQCGEAEYLEFDHIIPHSKGGANTAGNIQLLCRRCNLAKKDRI